MLVTIFRNHSIKYFTGKLIAPIAYAFAFILGCIGPANAALIQYSNDIVVDDNGTALLSDDLFFYRDLSRFNNMTYLEQLASIDLLNTELAGANPWNNDWHLANPTEMYNLMYDNWVDVPDVFLPSSVPNFFTGRIDDVYSTDPLRHYVYEVYLTGGSPPMSKDLHSAASTSAWDGLGAWAVATYGGVTVPEPSTILLLVAGLAGMGFTGRNKKQE